MSAETRVGNAVRHVTPERKAVQELAANDPESFLKLIGKASLRSQDILIQYFLLRRTKEQIGDALGIPEGSFGKAMGRAVNEIANGASRGPRDSRSLVRPRFLGALSLRIDEDTLGVYFQSVNGNV